MESSGLTALHEAARHGNLQVITTLLSHKATIDPLPLPHAPLSPGPQFGYNGRRRREEEEEEQDIDEHTWITPLYVAVDNGQRELVKELVSHGAKILPHIEMLAAQLGNPGTSSFSSPSFSLSLFPSQSYISVHKCRTHAKSEHHPIPPLYTPSSPFACLLLSFASSSSNTYNLCRNLGDTCTKL